MLRHILLIAWYYLHWAEQAFCLRMPCRKMWVTGGLRLLCVYANRKMAVINDLIDEDKVFVQKEDIAEQMNNHFCSLGSKLASCIPDTASQPEDFLGRTDLNFCFRPVNVGNNKSLK